MLPKHSNNLASIQDRAITFIALLFQTELVLRVLVTALGPLAELMQLLIGNYCHLELLGC
jgi:hypothetical protein